MATNQLVLLTSATTDIGGRPLKALEAQGTRVRCLARQTEFLRARIAGNTEIFAGDVLDSASLARAMNGVDTAYYLVHSMQRGGDFSEKGRQAAQNFGAAARAAGVRRIISAADRATTADRQELSAHLRSRYAVSRTNRARRAL
jgi:uncharacterized protein YbjT (DUF2867 family)